MEKHTAPHMPAETLSSGWAPSQAGRCRNAHISLFWPNRFRREAETAQTSLAPWLCSALIITLLLLLLLVAKTWALLQPLVDQPPARDGEREKEGMWSADFPSLAGATGLKPWQSSLLPHEHEGRAAPAVPPPGRHPLGTGDDPSMGTAPQPSSGSCWER